MEIIDCNEMELVLYQVKKSDTLHSISKKFDVNISGIVRNNSNIDLYEGEVVRIVRNTKIKHIVKPMENLHLISQKYNVNMDDIIKLNNLSSKRIFVGQSLIIPNK